MREFKIIESLVFKYNKLRLPGWHRRAALMEYQQLPPPPVPGVLHQAHHQQHQQQPVQPPHPHIVVAPAHQQQPQQPPPPPLPPTSHGHQVHAPLPPIHEDSTSSRWSQYQHLWRQHHVYLVIANP
ncbi:hypothetical protein WN51_07674 [Melipona quadrifasciata]|uniref:Uncharacterized protein n=1 Tax=Melipona quadrifasciata TaxID=166423 RepID=A0A0N1IT02_9HYME|nr:hypothetical protein WN51_07674 [Melipona quadrifasciata]